MVKPGGVSRRGGKSVRRARRCVYLATVTSALPEVGSDICSGIPVGNSRRLRDYSRHPLREYIIAWRVYVSSYDRHFRFRRALLTSFRFWPRKCVYTALSSVTSPSRGNAPRIRHRRISPISHFAKFHRILLQCVLYLRRSSPIVSFTLDSILAFRCFGKTTGQLTSWRESRRSY